MLQRAVGRCRTLRGMAAPLPSRAATTTTTVTATPAVAGRGPEPLLFTPGPLTTSATTKAAMLTDLGSRDPRFLAVVREVRAELLAMAGVSQAAGYEAVIMQGSGSFGVEAVLGATLPRTGGKLLVAENGAYGKRMARMASLFGVPVVTLSFPERAPVDVAAVVGAVDADAGITHVATVHHETTAGVLNPAAELGVALAGVRGGSVTYVLDSMSAFGAYPLDMAAARVHFLVSSSNKNIEGVPGFSYALCHAGALAQCAGNARSVSLDLHEQWRGLEATGQFRFTPPTHTMLAFRQALREHAAEGGSAGRLAR